MSYYKNNNSKKFGAIAVCFVLIGIILCGMMTSWFTDWNPYCWFGHDYDDEGICTKCGAEQPVEIIEPEQPDDEEPLENGGMVASVVPSKTNMRLGARRAAQTSAGENTYELTATITPAGADFQSVVWSIAWKNDSSEWAKGKTVTDYVTVTPNGLKATVTCLQAFGEQVVVTVISVDHSDVTASCNVDYVEKVLGLSFDTTSFASTSPAIECSFDTSVCTIKATLSKFVDGSTIKLTDDFYALLKNKFDSSVVLETGINLNMYFALSRRASLNGISSGDGYTLYLGVNTQLFSNSSKLVATSSGIPFCFINYNYMAGTDPIINNNEHKEYIGYVKSVFRKAVEEYDSTLPHATFDMSFTSTYNGVTYSSGTQTIEVRFDVSNLYVSVTDLTLNTGSIIF